MLFRPATEADFDAVWSVIEDGRASLAAQGLDQWQGGSPSQDMIRSDMANGFTYVAVDKKTGAILGTLAFMDQGEPDYERMIQGAWTIDLPVTLEAAKSAGDKVRYVALHRVAVSAAAARKGVATFMIQQSADMARERELKALRADTHAGNIPMQRTFEKCGMVRCCEVDISHPLEPTKRRIGYELAL